ncbi:hypothetical protein OGAPHI_001238 [Ogataea philodendri]|uniref:Uncharacterized protein n=1 Tax=Ogataea philodendri TaxID=1378263 RepID=A0A9P8PEC7_9ASCO|nr:uncharacterized protein OGAPHI_001238 [Ogataea philodendri]KAH3670723.1 hypothetical protein OGAPHI_001238 [Ogataea philodendri]
MPISAWSSRKAFSSSSSSSWTFPVGASGSWALTGFEAAGVLTDCFVLVILLSSSSCCKAASSSSSSSSSTRSFPSGRLMASEISSLSSTCSLISSIVWSTLSTLKSPCICFMAFAPCFMAFMVSRFKLADSMAFSCVSRDSTWFSILSTSVSSFFFFFNAILARFLFDVTFLRAIASCSWICVSRNADFLLSVEMCSLSSTIAFFGSSFFCFGLPPKKYPHICFVYLAPVCGVVSYDACWTTRCAACCSGLLSKAANKNNLYCGARVT